jgi:hypothetical protein
MNRIMSVLTFAVGAAAAMPATAQFLDMITYMTRKGNFTSTSTAWVNVPLDEAGDTKLYFANAAGLPLRVIYNAECGVKGPPQSHVAIEILVDGKPTNPASGSDFAFCTATSTDHYNWLGATRQSTFEAPNDGDLHYIEVRAIGVNGPTEWWLGDSSVVLAT